MATKLYPKLAGGAPSGVGCDWGSGTNTPNMRGTAVPWATRGLQTTPGASNQGGGITTIAGPVLVSAGLEVGYPASGMDFVSPPVAAAVTISGSVTWNLWGYESSMSANAALNGVLDVIDGKTGAITQIVRSNNSTELALSVDAVNNFATTPAAGVVVKKGDRLRFRPYFSDGGGTMASSFATNFTYNGGTAGVTGDSWIQLTENVTFASEPAGTQVFPTNTATDFAPSAASLVSSFTGADESPLSEGGNWASLNTSQGPLQRLSNGVCSNTAGSIRLSYWTPANFGPDVEAVITVQTALASLNNFGLIARITAEGGAGTYNGYRVGYTHGTPGTIVVQRVVATASTTLATVTITALTLGAQLGIRCYGSSIEAWYKPSGGSWTLAAAAEDFTYMSAGKVAIFSNDTTFRLDDFSAGSTLGTFPFVGREAWTSRGAGVQTDVTNTVTGWVPPIQVTDTAAGTPVDWFTKKLAAFTLGGAVRVNARIASPGQRTTIRCEIAKISADGSTVTEWGATSWGERANSLPATEAAASFLVSGDDLAVADDERIRIRFLTDDSPDGASTSGTTVTLYYAGASGATGDTFVTFSQSLSQSVPSIKPSGIASAEAFGTATLIHGPVNIIPTGLATQESFGTFALVLTYPAKFIQPSAIPSSEVVGAATLIHGNTNILPVGDPSDEALGTPSFLKGGVVISPVGIATQESFATFVVRNSKNLLPTGIASAEVLGAPTLIHGAVLIQPSGIASGEAFGSTTLVAAASLASFILPRPIVYASDYKQAVLDDSPVAYWRLGDKTGTTAVAQVGGVDGTYNGSNYTLGQPSLLPNDDSPSVLFMPTLGTRGDMSVASPPLPVGFNPWSYELIFKRNGISGSSYYFLLSTGTGTPNIYIQSSDNLLYVDDDNNQAVHSSVPITSNQQHHILVTKAAGSAAIPKIYLDGVDVSVAGSTPVWNGTAPSILTVGDYYNRGLLVAPSYAYIDEVAVYSTELTPAQARAHSLSRFSPYAQAVLADNPRAYWRLGELSGTVARDETGSGNNGTYINNPILGAPGGTTETDTAITLDGSTQYVQILDDAKLDLGDSVSVEALIRRTNDANLDSIVMKGGAYGLQLDDNTVNGQVLWRQDGGGIFAHANPGISADGLVHHVVGTKSGSTRKVYIDGVDVTILDTNVTLTDTGNELNIGRQASNGTRYFHGSIDDAAVYSYALTAAQVAAHYAAAKASTAQRFGLLTLAIQAPATNILPAGIASGEAIGAATLIHGNVNILPVGDPSDEVFGSPTLLRGGVLIQPTAIPSAEAFGLPVLITGAGAILPAGIASAEALGSHTLIHGAVIILPTGIASAEAIGSTTLVHGSVNILPTGIGTAEALGAPALLRGGISILPVGIATQESFGTFSLITGNVNVIPSGIASAEVIGSHTLVKATVTSYILPPSISAPGEGAFAPDDLSGLALWWLPADIVAAPMVGTPPPSVVTNVLNGQPIARFNTNEGRVRVTSGLGVTNNYTIAYVARLRDANMGRVVNSIYPPNNFLLGFWNGFEDVGYDGGFFTPDMRAAQTTNWKLYSADGVSGTSRLFSDGNYLSSGFGGAFGDMLAIGGYDPTLPAETPNADVAEVILYDHALSDSDRQLVEGYLRAKYFGAGVVTSSFGTPTLVTSAAIIPAGVASQESFNPVTLVHGNVNIQPTGIATAESVGTPTLVLGQAPAVSILPSGIPTAEAVGTHTLVHGSVSILPSGIGSQEVLGTPTLLHGSVNILPTGITSGEIFGSTLLSTGAFFILPFAITSGEAVGNPTLLHGAVSIQPAGIATQESFGPVTLTATAAVLPVGIASQEAVGTPTLLHGNANIIPTGIPSAEALGTPSLLTGAFTVQPAGIATQESFGSIALLHGNANIQPTGIATQESFGAFTLKATSSILPAAIGSGETLGNATLITGNVNIIPTGIASGEAFGTAILTSLGGPRFIAPAGIVSAESFGTHVLIPGNVNIAAAGISSAQVFGTAILLPGAVTINQALFGIPSAETFGSPTLLTGAGSVSPTGIVTGEALGVPVIIPGTARISVTGVPTAESFGSIALVPRSNIIPGGISSAELLGLPILTVRPQLAIAPPSITSAELFGLPKLTTGAFFIYPVGISSAEAFGIPLLQGERSGWTWTHASSSGSTRQGGWPETQGDAANTKDGGWPELQGALANTKRNEGDS